MPLILTSGEPRASACSSSLGSQKQEKPRQARRDFLKSKDRPFDMKHPTETSLSNTATHSMELLEFPLPPVAPRASGATTAGVWASAEASLPLERITAFKGFQPPAGAGAEPPAKPLEKTTDNLSPLDPKIRQSRQRFDWLRRHSVVERQRSCKKKTVDGTAFVIDRAGRWRCAGLIRCERVDCPDCGAVIAATRRADIELAGTRAIQYHGMTLAMLTFTFGHRLTDSLEKQVKARQAAWVSLGRGKGWDQDKSRYRVKGYVRVLEETWGEKFGWHAHIHVLVFLEHTPGSVEAKNAIKMLARSMFGRWSRAVVKNGMRKPSFKGQDAHEVTGKEAAADMGAYLVKQLDTPKRRLASAVAWEMTAKDGKIADKITAEHFAVVELLDLAMDNEAWAAELYAERELAMLGHRTIQWSRDIRELLGMNEEEDAAAALAEADELKAQDRVALSIQQAGWSQLSRIRYGMQRLLEVGEQYGDEAAIVWLDKLGIEAKPGAWEFDGQD